MNQASLFSSGATKSHISIDSHIIYGDRYMDLAKEKTMAALEAIIELESFSQYGVWKKSGTSFITAHNLVHYLLQKNVIAKVDKKYTITSWPGLLSLFSAFRTFPKPIATLQLAISLDDAKAHLQEKGFIFCLTTAWQYYDDYLRDPQVHVYAPSKAKAEQAIKELSQLAKGTTIINIYLQDAPVKPVSKKGMQLTSLPRTLLDLYSSHYAYGTDNWIRKKATQWQRESATTRKK
jgi:hypothetical protein